MQEAVKFSKWKAKAERSGRVSPAELARISAEMEPWLEKRQMFEFAWELRIKKACATVNAECDEILEEMKRYAETETRAVVERLRGEYLYKCGRILNQSPDEPTFLRLKEALDAEFKERNKVESETILDHMASEKARADKKRADAQEACRKKLEEADAEFARQNPFPLLPCICNIPFCVEMRRKMMEHQE